MSSVESISSTSAYQIEKARTERNTENFRAENAAKQEQRVQQQREQVQQTAKVYVNERGQKTGSVINTSA